MVVCVVSGDMERLKWFNDVFGHDTADNFIVAAIKAYSKRASQVLAGDFEYILFRIQGDETLLFVIGEQAVPTELFDQIYAPVEHADVALVEENKPIELRQKRTEKVHTSYGLRSMKKADISEEQTAYEHFHDLIKQAGDEAEERKARGLIGRIHATLQKLQRQLEPHTMNPNEHAGGSFRRAVLELIPALEKELADKIGSIRLGGKQLN